MDALFIGQSYIDIVLVADQIPTGDEKAVAEAYAVSFGGNAVTAAFACAKLGIAPDLIATVADDWLGGMFTDMARKYAIPLHARKVRASSLSMVMPREGKRAILRARDDHYLHPFPLLDLGGCRALHLDGHQGDAALHYARLCREGGILTSLDGGGLRPGLDELLSLIDVAVVAERLCEQMGLAPPAMLDHLRAKVCRVGGVTLGESGLLWFDAGDGRGGERRHLPALAVPSERVVDTNGAGDVFHGAYLHSYLANPAGGWEDHFRFARAASAHKVQHLGNEAGLPTLEDVRRAQKEFGESGEG